MTSQQPDTQPDEIKTNNQDKNGGNRKEGIDKVLDDTNQKQTVEEGQEAASKESLNKVKL